MGSSTKNWNSWFQTGALWRPAWLVASSRRLHSAWDPRMRRQYGLLCQEKPQTGRLRASNRLTYTFPQSLKATDLRAIL